MATPRKRSTGFSSSTAEGTLDESRAGEVVEEISPKVTKAAPKKETPVEEFVEQSIVPTEDPGPRFVEVEAVQPEVKPVAPQAPRAPKRHPRNIPKFSSYK